MEIVTVRLDDLVPDPKNARAHPKQNIDAIKASLKRFGQVLPILVRDKDSQVVAGNGTLEAMRELGWAECKAALYEGDDQDCKALAIALNRTAELAEWNEENLAATLAELKAEGYKGLGAAGFDEAALGAFVAGEIKIADVIDVSGYKRRQAAVIEDVVPEPPTTPVTRPGDLWHLGAHRLVCADCASVKLPPESIDLLVTDPPYGVSYADKNTFLNAVAPGNRIQTPIENDHHTAEEMSVLWRTWFSVVREAMRPGAAYYVTGPQGGDLLFLLLLALRDSGFPLRHMLVWAKNMHVLGRSDYHYKHEPIMYGWVDGAHHAVENRSETSLWEIDKPHVSDLHPTMKPVELYARAMRNSTDAGQTVIDPFAGSGTCVVAAEQLGRVAICMEISPAYCDVIVDRWQNLTGGKAIRGQAVS